MSTFGLAMKRIINVNVFFVRHGETDANARGLVQGVSSDDFELNEVGRGQAEKVADRLSDVRFRAALSSGFRRARQTADIIARRNKHFNGQIEDWPVLRERSFGPFEGRTIHEFTEEARKAGFSPNVFDYSPEGAETLTEVTARAALFFKDLIEELKKPGRLTVTEAEDCTILVVSHGRFLKELLIHLHDSLEMLAPVSPEEFRGLWPSNTAVSQVSFNLTASPDSPVEPEQLQCLDIHCSRHLL